MASKEARSALLQRLGSHKGKLMWGERSGKCHYMYLKDYPCDGGQFNECQGRYTDDYGMSDWCRNCGGSGTIHVPQYVRVPAFDAPEVPNDWIPDWIRAKTPKAKRKKKRKKAK